jgi:hypothetical protein
VWGKRRLPYTGRNVVQIISVDQRAREQRGVTICLAGFPGIGKTSQVRTLRDRLPNAIMIDCEAGDLAIADVSIDTIHGLTWEELCDIGLILGGPDPVQAPSIPKRATMPSLPGRNTQGSRHTTRFSSIH